MQYKLPRLTGSFRAFSELARPNSSKLPEDNIEEYRQWKANQLKE
jgi:hypothetical protein